MPRGASIIEYRGKRGVVYRIKYSDADGRQVMETVGAERDGVTRRQAEAELRERLVRVERKQYRRPKPLTFAEWSATWFEEGQRRRAWKPRTVKAYENAIGRLDGYFGPHRLNGIRPRDVSGFIRHVMAEPDERTGETAVGEVRRATRQRPARHLQGRRRRGADRPEPRDQRRAAPRQEVPAPDPHPARGRPDLKSVHG